jgi:hypothetical protein
MLAKKYSHKGEPNKCMVPGFRSGTNYKALCLKFKVCNVKSKFKPYGLLIL